MRGKYKIPKDVPSAACGRCIWFKPDYKEGWGKCLIHDEKRYYKCMVCSEYELETDIELET